MGRWNLKEKRLKKLPDPLAQRITGRVLKWNQNCRKKEMKEPSQYKDNRCIIIFKGITPTLPSPLRRLCRNQGKGPSLGPRIKYGVNSSRNPVFDFIQFLEILDARFRWHDKLGHSLPGGGSGLEKETVILRLALTNHLLDLFGILQKHFHRLFTIGMNNHAFEQIGYYGYKMSPRFQPFNYI